MEMEQPRGGARKVVTFEENTIIGRRRNGSLSAHHDVGRDLDAGRAARPLRPPGAVSRRRTYADGELDVFAAERYFKGAMDGVHHHRKEVDGAALVAPPAPLEMTSARPSPAKKPAGSRASAASSVTSANSQTVLLRGRRGDRDRKKCCVQVGALMRSCSGKRSVRVDGGGAAREENKEGEPAASMIDWYRELRMQKAALGVVAGDRGAVVAAAAGLPPSSLSHLGHGTAKVAAIGREVILEEKPAEFTTSRSRRRSFTLVAPVIRGGGNEHDDDDDDGAGSESSSDLFEIKSLMIDECPYEPSEASIQWSVATASAAAADGRGQLQVAAGRRQRRDRLLSGCVSHRAVDVSAAAPTTNAPRRRGQGSQKARNRA